MSKTETHRRDKFEEMMSSQFNYSPSDFADKCSKGSPYEGEYRNQSLQDYWEVWQAAVDSCLDDGDRPVPNS